MRKKAVCLVVLGCLLLAGFLLVSCGKKETWTDSVVRTNRVGVDYGTVSRGDQVTIVGQDGSYYRVKSQDGKNEFLVESWLVRSTSEKTPEAYTGYATEGAKVYGDAYLSGEAKKQLKLDEQVEVQDAFGSVLFVKAGDQTGYVAADSVKKKTSAEEENAAEDGSQADGSSYQYSYNGGNGYSYYEEESSSYDPGSGSGGSSDSGSGSSNPSYSSSDGDDISMNGGSGLPTMLLSLEKATLELANYAQGVMFADGSTSSNAPTSASKTATVLSDNAKTYLAFLNRGDRVEACWPTSTDQAAKDGSSESSASKVTDDVIKVKIGENTGTVPAWTLRPEAQEAYAAWNGFAVEGAVAYGDYRLSEGAFVLGVNTPVQVVDKFDSFLIVQVNNAFYCMKPDEVSAQEIEVAEESSQESSGGGYYYYGYYENDDSGHSGSTGGTGGSYVSGSGSSGSAPAPVAEPTTEWTETVM